MIRPLRRRHLALVTGLAVVGPGVFALGLASRRGPPVVEAFPAAVEIGFVAEASDTVRLEAVRFRLDRGRSETGERAIRVVPLAADLADSRPEVVYAPDVLVYWSPTPAAGTLPDDAVLLGPLRGARGAQFVLPPASAGGDGFLLAFSLGHQRLLGTAAITLPPGDG